MQGRELTQFVADFTWYLRNLLLAKTSDQIEDVIDMSSDNLQKLKEEAMMAKLDTILRFIRIFSELSDKIRYASQKRIVLETTIIKLCRPEMEAEQDTLADRIRKLEKRLDKGVVLSGQNIPPSEESPKEAEKVGVETAESDSRRCKTIGGKMERDSRKYTNACETVFETGETDSERRK